MGGGYSSPPSPRPRLFSTADGGTWSHLILERGRAHKLAKECNSVIPRHAFVASRWSPRPREVFLWSGREIGGRFGLLGPGGGGEVRLWVREQEDFGSYFTKYIAHLSRPWSNGWVALSFLFVCSVGRCPAMVTSSPPPLLLAPDPQTHTFSESLW